MAQFPRVNSEIKALANNMVSGIAGHPDMFPSADAGSIQAVLDEFDSATYALHSAQALAKNTATAKAAACEKLKAIMKNQIRLARVDSSANPVNLSYLGVNARRKASAIDPPSSAMGLTVQYLGEKGLALSWDKPIYNIRRPVRIYLVQKRPADDRSVPWELEGASYENRYQLPVDADSGNCDGKTLYRIIATNDNGSSLPSNEITLPPA